MSIADEPLNRVQRVAAEPSPRRVAWLLFGLLLVTYVVTGKGFTEISDAENYLTVTRSLVEQGWVDISTEDALTPHTLRGTWHVQGPDGRTYSLWGLGYSLLQAPFYVLGKASAAVLGHLVPAFSDLSRFVPRLAVSVVGPLITALTVVLLFHILLAMGLRPTWATFGALLYGVATIAWPYSKLGFYEPFQTLCALTALAAAVHYRRHRRNWALAAAGFALGWGACTKLVLLPLLVPVAGYLLWVVLRDNGLASISRRRLWSGAGCFLAGLLPWIAVILWYNWVRTGSVLQTGQRAADLMFSFAPSVVLSRFVYYFFSPGSGLFIYAPLLLLGFLGLRRLWRHWKAETILGLAMVAVLAGPYLLQVNILDLWSWGPRYMVPIVPPLMIPAVLGMQRLWETARGRRVVMGFVGLSLIVQALAIATPFGNHYRRVEDHYGTTRAIAYEPGAFPIWGQVTSLLQTSFAPIHASSRDLATGIIPQHIKSDVRRSLDFWWVYAYRLGLPRGMILTPLLLLVAAGALLSQRLVLSLRPAHSSEHRASAG